MRGGMNHCCTAWTTLLCLGSGDHMRGSAHGFSPEHLRNIDEVIAALRELVSAC